MSIPNIKSPRPWKSRKLELLHSYSRARAVFPSLLQKTFRPGTKPWAREKPREPACRKVTRAAKQLKVADGRGKQERSGSRASRAAEQADAGGGCRTHQLQPKLPALLTRQSSTPLNQDTLMQAMSPSRRRSHRCRT